MKHNIRIALAAMAALAVAAFATTVAAADIFAGLRLQTLQTSPTEKIDVALWYPTATKSQSITLGPHLHDVAMGAHGR